MLKRAAAAGRRLAELKGASAAIPNQSILINTLTLQEAKDSSAIENIVTTNDELYRESLFPEFGNDPAAKEVRRYGQALRTGYDLVTATGLLTNNHILRSRRSWRRTRRGSASCPARR